MAILVIFCIIQKHQTVPISFHHLFLSYIITSCFRVIDLKVMDLCFVFVFIELFLSYLLAPNSGKCMFQSEIRHGHSMKDFLHISETVLLIISY